MPQNYFHNEKFEKIKTINAKIPIFFNEQKKFSNEIFQLNKNSSFFWIFTFDFFFISFQWTKKILSFFFWIFMCIVWFFSMNLQKSFCSLKFVRRINFYQKIKKNTKWHVLNKKKCKFSAGSKSAFGRINCFWQRK